MERASIDGELGYAAREAIGGMERTVGGDRKGEEGGLGRGMEDRSGDMGGDEAISMESKS